MSTSPATDALFELGFHDERALDACLVLVEAQDRGLPNDRELLEKSDRFALNALEAGAAHLIPDYVVHLKQCLPPLTVPQPAMPESHQPPFAYSDPDGLADALAEWRSRPQEARGALGQGDDPTGDLWDEERQHICSVFSALVDSEPMPQEWVEGLLVHPTITLVAGAGGARKSTIFFYYLMQCLALGEPPFGEEALRPPKPLRILVLAEDPPALMKDRFEAFAAEHGFDRQAVGKRLHYRSGPILHLNQEAARIRLDVIIEKGGYDLLAIDGLTNHLGAADENRATDVNPAFELFRRMVARGTGVIGLLHIVKSSSRRKEIEESGTSAALAELIRGNGHIVNSARSAYLVNDTAATDVSRIRSVKNNYIPNSLDWRVKVEIDRSLEPHSIAWDGARITKLSQAAATSEDVGVLVARVRSFIERHSRRPTKTEAKGLADGRKQDQGRVLKAAIEAGQLAVSPKKEVNPATGKQAFLVHVEGELYL